MRRRSIRVLAILAGVLLLYTAVGFLAVPPIARSQLQALLAAEFDRPVRIERIEFNPFLLKAAAEGVTVGDRDPALPPALAIDRLDVNAAWRSVVERAPVIESLRLNGLVLRLARAADGELSVQDLLRRWSERPAEPDRPPPRFAIANIELDGGRLAFDDRLESRAHEITDLVIRVPFISSLPVYQEVNVEPRIAATVNGAAVEIGGRSQPFSDDHESSIEFEIAPIDLAPYVGYLPQALPVKVVSLAFGADVRIDFAQAKGGPPKLTIGGQASLSNVDVRAPDDAPLLAVASIRAQSLALQPLAGEYEVGRVDIDQPAATVSRRASEPRFFEQVLAAIAAQAAPPKPPAQGAPKTSVAPRWKIGDIAVTNGSVDLRDERFSPRTLALKASGLTARVAGVGSDLSASLAFELGAQLESGERIEASGSVRPQPLLVEGKVSVEPVALKYWWWIAEPQLQADLSEGRLGLRTAFSIAENRGATEVRLTELAARLDGLRLRQRWDRRDLLGLATLTIDAADLDLGARQLRIGSLETTGGRLAIVRDRAGELNLAKLLRPGAVPAPAAAPAASPAASPAAAPAAAPGAMPAGDGTWSVLVRRVALGQWDAVLSDEAAGPAADLRIGALKLDAENLGNASGTQGKLTLTARVGQTGTLDAGGQLAINPLSARIRVDARRLGMLPLQPYFTRYVNARVSSGLLTAKGEVALDLAERQPLKARFAGDLTIAEFAAAAKSDGEELLRWKSLHFGGIDFALQPLKVDVGEIALSEFYTRLVLNADGKLNLRELVVQQGLSAVAAAPATTTPTATTTTTTATTTATTSAATTTARDVPASVRANEAVPARIGRITFANGNIDFSDNFVKPNYSANLTGMNGTVSTLAAETPGNFELRGRIDHGGSVEITGSVNPFAADLFLDLKADARDIELPRASPYSVKYLGYGIEKGKLSAKVAYKVKDRRLEAENNIILDQLTFGERVESPSATKLPVLFAVALLKDRNGVIDVNMPIGGSLDDPDFSVGGIVLKVVLNLIVKAVTAPFALLANLVGGGAELSHLQFAPGAARLQPEAGQRLEALASALGDRPGLKLDITGRADPAADRLALIRIEFERRLKVQKLRERVGAGGDPAAGDAAAIDPAAIDPAEYARLLQLAYRAADFPKPRNAIGLVRDLPPAEMEQLMLANITVSDDALRELADARARAVKDWLAAKGGIAGERLFILAPRLGSEGLAQGAGPTSAELSLK